MAKLGHREPSLDVVWVREPLLTAVILKQFTARPNFNPTHLHDLLTEAEENKLESLVPGTDN